MLHGQSLSNHNFVLYSVLSFPLPPPPADGWHWNNPSQPATRTAGEGGEEGQGENTLREHSKSYEGAKYAATAWNFFSTLAASAHVSANCSHALQDCCA